MSESHNSSREQSMEKYFFRASSEDFKKIPGSPISYSASNGLRNLFLHGVLSNYADTRLGMATADNNRFLRFWHEVSHIGICFSASNRQEALQSRLRWFPYQKGGEYRKWYGNAEYCVDWENDGESIQSFKDVKTGKVRSHNYNLDFIFCRGVTWNALTSGKTSARISENSLFDNAGSSLFVNGDVAAETIMGLVNSNVMLAIFPLISPTLNYQPGDISKLPAFFPDHLQTELATVIGQAIEAERKDWNSYETSWDFISLPLLSPDYSQPTLKASYHALRTHWREMTREMQRLEQENNRIFIDAYGLQDELTPEVPLSEITLTCNPHYRYGGNKSDEELEALLQADTLRELVSYAIGCMMGRYSLDEPGLVYAEAGNVGFQRLVDDGAYQSFAADGDGILPLTEDPWFEDDIAERLRAFIKQVWGETTLTENLEWLADNLGRSPGDTAMQGLRSYLARGFYKDHLKTYKRRPIYWLFSSGKHKAFECLVYLHRYHEGTLSRIRLDYVHPLLSKFDAHHQQLVREQAEATTTSEKNRLKKALAALEKKQVELADFDDRLKHYAERRIRLDLDDGVKVNYGKFGDLLAEVKAVTGGSSDN